jgi:hypothetical protein
MGVRGCTGLYELPFSKSCFAAMQQKLRLNVSFGTVFWQSRSIAPHNIIS